MHFNCGLFCDQILWVKKTVNNNVQINQGYYFLHSTEMCLVGIKKDSNGNSLEFIPKVPF
jgi:N6-adenosine-specific RNA methylase IME4